MEYLYGNEDSYLFIYLISRIFNVLQIWLSEHTMEQMPVS